MQYTEEELKKIIENNQHWIKEDCDGWEDMRANLERANLEYANLEYADLEYANLKGTNLYRAILEGASLKGANLEGATLEGANLEYANLEGANLYRANLYHANLYHANLKGANLYHATLEGATLEDANLYGAYLEEKEKFRLGQILKEPMIGYKKTKEGVVITATIPAGAIVFCIKGSKYRTNKARIIDMGGQKEVLHSSYDEKFEYRLMQDIEIEDFNLMYNVECASGFHFFRTREEAENYNI